MKVWTVMSTCEKLGILSLGNSDGHDEGGDGVAEGIYSGMFRNDDLHRNTYISSAVYQLATEAC